MIALLVVTLPWLAAEQEYEPTSNYTVQQIEGFTVYVNNRLLGEQKELGDKVLQLLRVKCYDVNRVVPEAALVELHKVPIWVEVADKQFPCCCYHPSREWLTQNGFNPDKEKSVEVANSGNFLTWTHEQPYMLLHELAHAYHHLVLGYDNQELKAAYKRAVESGAYESVLRYTGKMEKHYALNNEGEYFAELSEAYFGTNDFYPFVRAEVLKHDPGMYELLRKLWREEPAKAKP